MGGPKSVKAEKIVNDLVDVNFAAFATYFDGLLSMDEKAPQNLSASGNCVGVNHEQAMRRVALWLRHEEENPGFFASFWNDARKKPMREKDGDIS